MFECKDTVDDNGVVKGLPNKFKNLLSINTVSKVQLPTHCDCFKMRADSNTQSTGKAVSHPED